MKITLGFFNAFFISIADGRPKFLNETTLYVIKGNTSIYNIYATDPNNKGVEYSISFSDSAVEVSISKSGLLEITSNNAGKFNITIRATDICGAYADQVFIIESLKCPCEGHNNDGYCKWRNSDSNELECVCPDGCTGER